MLKKFRQDTRGATAIVFAFALPVLVAAGAAATMFAYQVMTKTKLQAALDAGALAGTALGASATDQQRIASARTAFNRNFLHSGKVAEGDSDYWVASGGQAPDFTVSQWEVTGEAVAAIDNPFSFFIGDRKLKIKARAVGAKMMSEPICILGLNPEHEETIDMTGQPVISANGCAVQANSSDGRGMNQKGKPMLKAKMIGTTGGYTGDGYDPPPIKGTIPVADPYKDVPFPPSSPCTYTDKVYSGGTATINPGVYCGGIRIKAGATVTMNPGIYVMKDGALWMNSNSELNGTEVMIAFTGPDATLYMEGTSSLDLTSPASGPYMNLQFMQEPGTGGDDLWFAVVGNNTFKYDGVLYAPTFDVWFGGGTIVTVSSPSYAMVADKIWIQDQSVIDVTLENKRNLPIASVGRFKYGARLIE